MKEQLLFIHSAGTQQLHEGSSDLLTYLQKSLGKTHEVRHPQMPHPENPKYQPWKGKLAKELADLDGEVILVGHSLGGSVLLKYLSEETYSASVAGLFLVATPYWGPEMEEYVLQEDFAAMLVAIPKIFLYHSHDDDVVHFAHLTRYAAKLPKVTVHELYNRGHYFSAGIPELITDIKRIGMKPKESL